MLASNARSLGFNVQYREMESTKKKTTPDLVELRNSSIAAGVCTTETKGAVCLLLDSNWLLLSVSSGTLG